jgi:hypothetical protein
LLAYVGPGPGLSLTWALVGLIATIVTAVFAVLFWPLRVLLRKIRGGGAEDEAVEQDDAAAAETVSETASEPDPTS